MEAAGFQRIPFQPGALSSTSGRSRWNAWAGTTPPERHRPPRAARSMKPRIQMRFTAWHFASGVGVVVSSVAA